MAARPLPQPQRLAPSLDPSGWEPFSDMSIDSDPQPLNDGGGYDDDEDDDFAPTFVEDDISVLDQDEEEEELLISEYLPIERYRQFLLLSSVYSVDVGLCDRLR